MAELPDNLDIASLTADQVLPKPTPRGEPYERDCLLQKGVSKFLSSTYALVSDASTDSCIAWTPEGTSFIIKDRDALISTVLARFYKHSNFQSFVRQLNMYGFRKLGEPHHWEFFHPAFLRGRPHILKYIRRRIKYSGASTAAADDDDASAEGTPAAPNMASGSSDEIVALRRMRDGLATDIRTLRTSHAEMEKQLSSIVKENADLRHELAEAQAEQARMQAAVENIMRLLPQASGVQLPANPRKRARQDDVPTPADPPAKKRAVMRVDTSRSSDARDGYSAAEPPASAGLDVFLRSLVDGSSPRAPIASLFPEISSPTFTPMTAAAGLAHVWPPPPKRS